MSSYAGWVVNPERNAREGGRTLRSVSGLPESDERAIALAAYGIGLLPQHQRLLLASGIDPDVAGERGYVSVDQKSRLAKVDFSPKQQRVAGLLIPVYGVGMDVVTHEYRPDDPREVDGKVVKYERPPGSRAHLDVPRRVLPALAEPSVELWITEGARKVDSLVSAGIAAIGIAGVWSWRSGGAPLADLNAVKWSGRRVVLAFDSDILCKPSVHQALVALRGELEGRAATVSVLVLPDGSNKCGVDDYLGAGHSLSELRALVTETLRPADGRAADRVLARRFEPTEMGSARRLVERHGHDLMYVADRGTWRFWDGRRWGVDVSGERHRRVKAVVDGLLDEVRDEFDQDRKKRIWRHYNHAQTARVQNGILALAQTERRVISTGADLDSDPWLLNVDNGTVDLRTGELRPHRREDRITKLAPVEFDAEATCPGWELFVRWVCCNDDELVEYLQRSVGYSLTGDVSEQTLPFCFGDGGNGKSTMLGVLQSMLGLGDDGYALEGAPRLLVAAYHAEHPTAIADLEGRRFVVCQETDQGARLDEARVKSLTGGDPITARVMRGDFFTFMPTMKLWLAANHLPAVQGTDHGIWRRVRLIPFNATIADRDRDGHLRDRLAQELPGILGWAVRGCLAWQRDGLSEPAAVSVATGTYRASQDHVSRFLADVCQLDTQYRVGSTLLYEAYKIWCGSNGEHPLSQAALAPQLHRRGFTHGKDATTRRVIWKGLGLVADEQ